MIFPLSADQIRFRAGIRVDFGDNRGFGEHTLNRRDEINREESMGEYYRAVLQRRRL